MITILTGVKWYLIVVLICISLMLSIFLCACWPSTCPLWKNVYSCLLCLFKSGCLFVWCWVTWAVDIFWILTSYQSYHLQIFFSLSVGCLFVSSMVSFAVQKLLNLIRSHLFIFAFVSFALGDRSKKYCYGLFCLYFPLGVLWFLVFHLGL